MILGTPALVINWSINLRKLFGSIQPPTGVVNTNPVSRQAGPTNSASPRARS